MADQGKWSLSGEYFENCNCDVACPCLISSAAPLTTRPTRGECDVAIVFHVDKGRHGDVTLDGLNVAVVGHWPGPMGNGGGEVALYVDERASDAQTAALGGIFGGADGGPMAGFAPIIAKNLGAKKVAIKFAIDGKARSVEIPEIMHMSAEPIPTMHPSGESWVAIGHPFAPEKLALAMGGKNSTFADHGMRWDNSGKNGHYAP